jgi:hypothetical protein
MGVAASAHAQVAIRPLAPQLGASGQTAPIKPAELHGVVRDERGNPLSGAVVSALGSSSAFAISDAEGRFSFRNLTPGPYLVRAHLANYLQARGRVVQVAPNGTTTSAIQLTKRVDGSSAPSVLPPASEAWTSLTLPSRRKSATITTKCPGGCAI